MISPPNVNTWKNQNLVFYISIVLVFLVCTESPVGGVTSAGGKQVMVLC